MQFECPWTINLDISLTKERILARLSDGTVVFDDVARASLKLDKKRRPYFVGIGSQSMDRESAIVLPVVSEIRFDPGVAAGVATYVAHKVWNDQRRGWKTILFPIDRLKVRLTVEGFERLAPEVKRNLATNLDSGQITWWVNGEKAKS